jgi:hypothetical protein
MMSSRGSYNIEQPIRTITRGNNEERHVIRTLFCKSFHLCSIWRKLYIFFTLFLLKASVFNEMNMINEVKDLLETQRKDVIERLQEFEAEVIEKERKSSEAKGEPAFVFGKNPTPLVKSAIKAAQLLKEMRTSPAVKSSGASLSVVDFDEGEEFMEKVFMEWDDNKQREESDRNQRQLVLQKSHTLNIGSLLLESMEVMDATEAEGCTLHSITVFSEEGSAANEMKELSHIIPRKQISSCEVSDSRQTETTSHSLPLDNELKGSGTKDISMELRLDGLADNDLSFLDGITMDFDSFAEDLLSEEALPVLSLDDLIHELPTEESPRSSILSDIISNSIFNDFTETEEDFPIQTERSSHLLDCEPYPSGNSSNSSNNNLTKRFSKGKEIKMSIRKEYDMYFRGKKMNNTEFKDAIKPYKKAKGYRCPYLGSAKEKETCSKDKSHKKTLNHSKQGLERHLGMHGDILIKCRSCEWKTNTINNKSRHNQKPCN